MKIKPNYAVRKIYKTGYYMIYPITRNDYNILYKITHDLNIWEASLNDELGIFITIKNETNYNLFIDSLI